MPQASQPLLFEVAIRGSPPEHSEGGNSSFSDMRFFLKGSPFERSENGNPALKKYCDLRCLFFLKIFSYLAPLEFLT